MRRIGALRDGLGRHPRHAILLAVVAGLLLARAPGALPIPIAAACACLLARRPPLAAVAALALLAGCACADARLRSLDRTALGPRIGHAATLRAVLLEPPRRSLSGARSALARLEGGAPGAGERVVLRVGARKAGSWPPGTGPGAIVVGRGELQALSRFDAWQRARGAHAVLLADDVRDSGRRRGGIQGLLDRVRQRAEQALAAGLEPSQAALARGMVLGDDSRLSDPVRAAFRRAGLSHLLG